MTTSIKNLSFGQFLDYIEEDLGGDITKLQADISMLDTEISKRTQPLMLQKQRLQKMLAIKQKQQQTELKRQGATPEAGENAQQGNQTTTPGSTGAATPGQQ